LIAGLELAADVGATSVAVRMDSKLVVEQITGGWKVKDTHLQELHEEASRLCERFVEVTVEWIPRELNSDADALANLAMDGNPSAWRPPAAVSVRSIEPTYVPPPADAEERVRTETPQTVRVEQTAALALDLGLWQPMPDEVLAEAIRTQAPDELVEIWDRLPAARWLAKTLTSRRLAWKRAQIEGAVSGRVLAGVSP
jgi:hypothetical protein